MWREHAPRKLGRLRQTNKREEGILGQIDGDPHDFDSQDDSVGVAKGSEDTQESEDAEDREPEHYTFSCCQSCAREGKTGGVLTNARVGVGNELKVIWRNGKEVRDTKETCDVDSKHVRVV